MTLGNMRQNGVRTLAITCGALHCHHYATIDVSSFGLREANCLNCPALPSENVSKARALPGAGGFTIFANEQDEQNPSVGFAVKSGMD